MSFSSTTSSVQRHFATFGKIVRCQVEKIQGRRIAFVEFSSEEEAAMALAQPRQTMDGKTVWFKEDRPKGMLLGALVWTPLRTLVCDLGQD